MKVLVVRHAKAEDKVRFAKSGQPDELRPLTRHGRKKMLKVARGLKRIFPRLDGLAMSPLTRAIETAAILHRYYPRARVFERDELAPGSRLEATARWLKGMGQKKTVAVVGHEPHLGELVGWFLTGQRKAIGPLKKGAACLLEFQSGVGPGKATLCWLLQPKQLRKLRD